MTGQRLSTNLQRIGRGFLPLALVALLLLPQPVGAVRLILHLAGNVEDFLETRSEEERSSEEIGLAQRGDRVPARQPLWRCVALSSLPPPGRSVACSRDSSGPNLEKPRRDQQGAGVRLRC